MGKMLVFEYAIIRIVPRVEKEEFVNAGVIIFCKRPEYLGVKVHLPESKVLALDAEADLEDIQKHLLSLKNIAEGLATDSPISALDAPSRFRWLSAKRSTIVQTSPTHTGMCEKPEDLLETLFTKYV